MKKIFAILLVSVMMFTFSSVASAEEPTQRVYAELLGTGTNFLNLKRM